MTLVLTVTSPEGDEHSVKLSAANNLCVAFELSNGESIHVHQCMNLNTGKSLIQVRSALGENYVSTVTVTIDPETMRDESVFDEKLSSGTEITLAKTCYTD